MPKGLELTKAKLAHNARVTGVDGLKQKENEGSLAVEVAINTSGFFAPFSKMCGAAEAFVGESVLQNEIEGDREVQLYGVADNAPLAEERMDCIVFDNSPMLLMALRVKGNRQRYANKWMFHMHNIVPSIFRCDLDMMAAAIRGVLSVGLRLGVNEAESRDGVSFYRGFLRLVSE